MTFDMNKIIANAPTTEIAEDAPLVGMMLGQTLANMKRWELEAAQREYDQAQRIAEQMERLHPLIYQIIRKYCGEQWYVEFGVRHDPEAGSELRYEIRSLDPSDAFRNELEQAASDLLGDGLPLFAFKFLPLEKHHTKLPPQDAPATDA